MRNIAAKITGIAYRPLLCRKLEIYDISQLDIALRKSGSFLLKSDKNEFAISWWVSAKRTRSYPYARVYDTLFFTGKKITIIPVFKDEGAGGDRDFLQWDTVSLMSLLGVYVIPAYYVDATINPRFSDKITDQSFDYDYLSAKINELAGYQSDALHWNILQTEQIAELSKKAATAYEIIAAKTGVAVHSATGIEKRIEELLKGKNSFMNYSRTLAQRAQHSESQTQHKKEKLCGTKGMITIKNYLGGNYYFTADEINIKRGQVFIVEGKHTTNNQLPALEDIKDGLLKMIIFSNLLNLSLNGKKMKSIAVLKLTSKRKLLISKLSAKQMEILSILKKEAKENGFEVDI